MNSGPTFGEYVRRLRRAKRLELQDVAQDSGLSVSHLSRIENDHAIPNPDSVVKLARVLDGDLNLMLTLANNLPKEILERLISQASGDEDAHHRTGSVESRDPSFAKALVEEIDPKLREQLSELAEAFGMHDIDVSGIFAVLQKLAQMTPADRDLVVGLFIGRKREDE